MKTTAQFVTPNNMNRPVIGDKSPDYPFGYGYCVCGCGKVTKIVAGVHLKFSHRSHNPLAVKISRDRANQRVRQERFSAGRSPESDGLLSSPDVPRVQQPDQKAILNDQVSGRLAQALAWTRANQEFITWHRKKLRARVNETAKHYQQDRRKRDPIFKLIAYVRGRIRGALKRKGVRKTTKTEKLLGCSVHELKNYLEAQFKDGMTWTNYGQWHVDHIKPCCSFDLTKPEEQRACFHYTNLQPLWADENYTKGGR
jgi:hypothetical protein